MSNLITRSAVSLSVIVLSVVLLLPNFLSQRLVVVFNEYQWNANGQKMTIDPEAISDFINDRENGLGLYFPRSVCKPEASSRFDATHRCVLTDHFITTARINELVQGNSDLIDEAHTGLAPSGVERFFGAFTRSGYKNLEIKLGLDLQGGMRATFQADFESYVQRLQEKYTPIISELKQKLSKPALPEGERKNAEAELEKIESQLTLTETRKIALLNEARNIINKRLASQNLTEPEVRIQPASYSIGVDMPGVANSTDVLDKIKDTVSVEYRIVNDDATNRVNERFQKELGEIRELYRKDRVDIRDVNRIMEGVVQRAGLSPEEGRIFLSWRRGRHEGTQTLPRSFRVLGPTILDGSDMTDASASANPESGWYQINFILSGAGAQKFGEITTNNKGKRLAILWGDRVVSDPVINGPILGGRGQITGDFSEKEAGDVANVIKEGALPISLDIISVSFVGPGLGQEAIVSGLISIFIGFVIVILFMIVYYRLSGVIAVMGLFINLILMTAILSLMEFTLTLPGFAGVILTVGMAVDANVIIFEKMKEDLRAGKSVPISIDNGYRASLWTILDSNVTTLIAAFILYKNGDGPIKGFAITLVFGLASSVYTSLFVTRQVYEWLGHAIPLTRLRPILGLDRRSV